MRLNLAAALATLLAGLVLLAGNDRTGWSNGYGYDGRIYGDLAEHFPGAVFGNEGVTPPGIGRFTGERPKGIDAYYVRRILPSAVVYYTMTGLGIEKTRHNVVVTFGVWNAVIIALVAFLWGLIADRFGLSRAAKLLGLFALVINFGVLKSSFYYPVLTDTFAFGFGAASLYFWLNRNTLGLVAATILGSFTWPTELVLGTILIMFPPGTVPLGRSPLAWSGESRRATGLKVAAAAIPALALAAYVIQLRATDYHAPEEIPLGGAFALSVLAAAAIVFAALLWLVPDIGRKQLRALGQAVVSWRVALGAGTFAAILAGQALIAERPGAYDDLGLLKSSIWYSALNPGLFLIVLVGFFGPILALAIVQWPAICRAFHTWGIGATLVAVFFVASCLLTESRKLIVLYPFMVFFVVIACERIAERRWFLPIFLAGSLVASRVWLPIGEFPLKTSETLTHFPAQKFFLSSGIWTSFDLYLVQAAALAALIAAFAALRPHSHGIEPPSAVPSPSS